MIDTDLPPVSGVDPNVILDALPIAVVYLDGSGRVRSANSAAENLLGRSAATLRGNSLSLILQPDSSVLDFVAQARRQGGIVSARELHLASQHIHDLNVDVTASPDREHDGMVLTLMPTRSPAEDAGADITPFAQIARTLGHEVKNPLAGIVGAAQLLARQASPEQQPLLSLIREEGSRIQRIVDRFTAFETFFSPKVRSTNVHEVLNSVVELARAGFPGGAKVEVQFDPSLPEIPVDPDHLHEACLNLVKNAVEAAAQHSHTPRVEVSTRYRAGFRFAGRDSKRARGALEIAVSDNGPGVPKAGSAQVFEPFYTSKSGGEGIGLAVVAEIMSAHGGFVSIDSKQGGACFKLLFPIARKVGTKEGSAGV